MRFFAMLMAVALLAIGGLLGPVRLAKQTRQTATIRDFKSLLSALPRWTTHRAREDGFMCQRWFKRGSRIGG